MPRYVMVNRRADKFTDQAKAASKAAVASALAVMDGSTRVVSDHNPADDLARRVVVFDAEAADVADMKKSLSPDVVIEPAIQRSLHLPRTPIELRPALPMPASAANAAGASNFRITATGGGKPLADIQVMFYVQDPFGQVRTRTLNTNKQGQAQIVVPPGYNIAAVEPIPYAGFWISLALAPASGATVVCPPIDKSGPNGSGWWHEAMGVDVKAKGRGSGIKVGVIDTGCGPHANLSHVVLVGAFVDGMALPPDQATDVAEHGTHTTGIIGARQGKKGDYVGMAPDCDLFHARVFKDETAQGGPTQADIINAIDALSRGHQCDLINLSLGGGPASTSEEDAFRDALQRGTLCICSSGNEAGPVEYPGAYPECAAVSAIGQMGWAPPGTFSAGNRPRDPALLGQDNLFLATFSSFGPNLACAGPGVGIVSTVPDRNGFSGAYMEMDGTSMASPAVCGTLAVILANDPHYKTLPRDISRSNAARSLLAQHCRDFGLAIQYEGRGLPHV